MLYNILAIRFKILLFLSFFCFDTKAHDSNFSTECLGFLKSPEQHQTFLSLKAVKYPDELPISRGLQESYYKALAIGIDQRTLIKRLSSMRANQTPKYVPGIHEAFYFGVAIGFNPNQLANKLFKNTLIPEDLKYNSTKRDAYLLALLHGFNPEMTLFRLREQSPNFNFYNFRTGSELAYYFAVAVGKNSQKTLGMFSKSQEPPSSIFSIDGLVEAYYFAIVYEDLKNEFQNLEF